MAVHSVIFCGSKPRNHIYNPENEQSVEETKKLVRESVVRGCVIFMQQGSGERGYVVRVPEFSPVFEKVYVVEQYFSMRVKRDGSTWKQMKQEVSIAITEMRLAQMFSQANLDAAKRAVDELVPLRETLKKTQARLAEEEAKTRNLKHVVNGLKNMMVDIYREKIEKDVQKAFDEFKV
jgi:hypothetical protein